MSREDDARKMAEGQREAAAMKALQQMRSEVDRLPEPDRVKLMALVEQIREQAKDPLFDCAMKIVAIENQLGKRLDG